MSRQISEADWKVFRQLHEIALERFFERAVCELERLVSGKAASSRERFWDVAELVKKRRNEARKLFDDFRRSTALLQLALIDSRDLLTAQEMSRFSPEARASVEMYRSLPAEDADEG